jgi:hypothetical protein
MPRPRDGDSRGCWSKHVDGASGDRCGPKGLHPTLLIAAILRRQGTGAARVSRFACISTLCGGKTPYLDGIRLESQGPVNVSFVALRVTTCTKCDEIRFAIVPRAASKQLVMDLQILHRAAPLTSPAVTLKQTMQLAIGSWREP